MISVVIPSYNRLPLLQQAVESVFHQTCDQVELILVDDGSTDGTEGFGAALATDKPNVHYLRLEHSGMPGQVRNAGARLAGGKYLAFLDSDDLWQSEKLARQLAFFEQHPEIRICHTREVWLRGGKEVSQAGQRHARSGHIFPDALKKCIIGPSTVMLERSLFEELGGFREDLEIAEDYELWLRLTNPCPVGYIDEPLVIKRGGHADQLSEKYGQIEIFRIEALKQNVDAGLFSSDKRRLACRELARKCRIYAAGCLKGGRTEEERQYRSLAQSYKEKANRAHTS